MIRGILLSLALILTAALPGLAQDRAQSLADIRAELGALGAELTALRSELVSSGAISQPGGSTMLERMEEMELALVRLTARSEELQFRIDRIVADGTNRLGDLEFRLVELEGGDVAALGQMPVLGGAASGGQGGSAAPAGGEVAGGPQPVATEQAQFDRAREVLGQRDFRTAITLFAAHAETWPGGPLTGEAHFLRGEALDGLGETAEAARAYLDSFSGFPEAPRAAEALLRLGLALDRLGQRQEACLTLAEVPARYPGSEAAGTAGAELMALGCR